MVSLRDAGLALGLLVGVVVALRPGMASGEELRLEDGPGVHEVHIWADFENCPTMFLSRLSGSDSEADANSGGGNYPSDIQIRKLIEEYGFQVVSITFPAEKQSRIVTREVGGRTLYWSTNRKKVTYQSSADSDSEESIIEDAEILKALVNHLLPDLERASVFFTAMVADSQGAARLKGFGAGLTSVSKFAQSQKNAIERVRKVRQLLDGNAALGQSQLEGLFEELTEIANTSRAQYDAIDESSRKYFEEVTGGEVSLERMLSGVNQMSGVNMSDSARKLANKAKNWGEKAAGEDADAPKQQDVAGVYNTGEYSKVRLDNDGRVFEARGIAQGEEPTWYDSKLRWVRKIEKSTRDGKEVIIETIELLDAKGDTFNTYRRQPDGSFQTDNPANPPMTR